LKLLRNQQVLSRLQDPAITSAPKSSLTAEAAALPLAPLALTKDGQEQLVTQAAKLSVKERIKPAREKIWQENAERRAKGEARKQPAKSAEDRKEGDKCELEGE
jgi:hypothetical protein